MGLFKKKCKNCGKEIEKGITKGGNNFCGPECLKKYDKEHPGESGEVCEFC